MIPSSLPMRVAIAGGVTLPHFSRLLRLHQYQDDPIQGSSHAEALVVGSITSRGN